MEENKKISVLTSLYNCEFFLTGYFDALAKIEGKEQTEVLLLHNEPKEKELEIIKARLPSLDFVKHIIIPEREGIYKTWNRGIRFAQGEYITVWNVDDVRFPDSVLQQAEALDNNPAAALVYGDIWISYQYGICSSILTNSPVYNQRTHKKFLSRYHAACFQMWRKSIHQIIGYYDEQFLCIADFDFQVRVAIHYPMVKVKRPLGIYLEGLPTKISFNGFQSIERNIVHLRYGAYEHLNLFDLPLSRKKYKKNQMLFFDEWVDWTETAQFGKMHKTMGWIIAFFKSCFWGIKQIVKIIIWKT